MQTYRNPIVPGFNPDPSVVLVDGIFYLVTSTFHLFPGLPVHASTNLVDWRLIGHGIHRKEQLSLFWSHSRVVDPGNGLYHVATGGLQAPTIRYHNGKFYIISTNISREDPDKPIRDNFFISTSDIWSGEWSDPVHFEFNGIDTSFFFEDDRCYVQGAWMMDRVEQPRSVIYQLELDINTGRALSQPRLIWEGHCRHDTEGPHTYKRGDWYYLLAAEGGTYESHKITIARSKSIWGPYESYEQNPILTAEGTQEYIQGVGHGELFQDGDGDWWIVVLGHRYQDGVWPLGRETFLARVDWPEGGWPKVQQPKMAFASKRIPAKDLPASVEASNAVYVRGRDHPNYKVTKGPAQEVIRLRPSSITLDDVCGLPTLLGYRQPNLEAAASVALDTAWLATDTHQRPLAGLTMYLDPIRYAYLAINYASSQIQFKAVNKARNLARSHSYHHDLRGLSLYLKVESSAKEYSFFYAQNSEGKPLDGDAGWVAAGTISTAELGERFFTGPIFGVFAQSTSDDSAFVTFRDFRVWDSSRAFET